MINFPRCFWALWVVGLLAACGDAGPVLHLGSTLLIWENSYDSPDVYDGDNAFAVAACDGLVLVVGSGGEHMSFDSGGAMLVLAYDAQSGHLMWEDTSGSAPFRNRAERVACEHSVAVVTGSLDGQIAMRSYDVSTGRVLWERRLGDNAHYEFSDARLYADTVFAAMREGRAGSTASLVQLAVDAESGAVLWRRSEDVADSEGTNIEIRIDASEERVCAVLSEQSKDGRSVVECRRAADGTVQWRREFREQSTISAVATRFATDADVLVSAVGHGETTKLRAFDPSTGRLIWERALPGATVINELGASEGTLVIAGHENSSADGEYNNTLVGTLEMNTGREAWIDRFDRGDVAVVAVDGRRFVVMCEDGPLRMYDATKANLMAEWPIDVGYTYPCMFGGIATENGRVFAAGIFITDDRTGNLDICVEAIQPDAFGPWDQSDGARRGT